MKNSEPQSAHVPGLEQVLIWAERHADAMWRKPGELARIVIDAGTGTKITIEVPRRKNLAADLRKESVAR